MRRDPGDGVADAPAPLRRRAGTGAGRDAIPRSGRLFNGRGRGDRRGASGRRSATGPRWRAPSFRQRAPSRWALSRRDPTTARGVASHKAKRAISASSSELPVIRG